MVDRSGLLLGHYRLIRRLGTGSFAEVYLGEHIYLKTSSAIKVFNAPVTDEDTPDFLREARTIAVLDHPHIIPVLDCGVEQHIPFLVMKYASEGTLRQRHPKGSRLPLEKIITYATQIASALQYAHDQKIIHRDVKPENILLGQNDTLFLSDFGIALIDQTTQPTQDIIGTWPYMAPEQFAGKPSRESDQYSLAIIAYEWICGKRPFQGTSYEIQSQHLHAPPPSLQEKVPGLASEVEQVIFKALEKDPRKRFNSIRAFTTALEVAYHDHAPQERSLLIAAQPVRVYSVNKPSIATQQQVQLQVPQVVPVSASPQIQSSREKKADAIMNEFKRLIPFVRWFNALFVGTLLLRFFLKLIGADPMNFVAGFLYALSDIALRPFVDVAKPSPINPPYQVFDWTALIATVTYSLVFWAITRFLLILISPES